MNINQVQSVLVQYNDAPFNKFNLALITYVPVLNRSHIELTDKLDKIIQYDRHFGQADLNQKLVDLKYAFQTMPILALASLNGAKVSGFKQSDVIDKYWLRDNVYNSYTCFPKFQFTFLEDDFTNDYDNFLSELKSNFL